MLAGEPAPVMWDDLTHGFTGRQVRVRQADGIQVPGYIQAVTTQSIQLCSKRPTNSGTCPGHERTITREDVRQLCIRGPRPQTLDHLVGPVYTMVAGMSLGFIPDMPWWSRPILTVVGTGGGAFLAALSASTIPVSIPHEWIRSKRSTCLTIAATAPPAADLLRGRRRLHGQGDHVGYCSLRDLEWPSGF